MCLSQPQLQTMMLTSLFIFRAIIFLLHVKQQLQTSLPPIPRTSLRPDGRSVLTPLPHAHAQVWGQPRIHADASFQDDDHEQDLQECTLHHVSVR